MAYLDKPGLDALWDKVKNWTNSVHAHSMTKGASSQDGLQLMLKNGAQSPATLSTVTITKGDITALGIPGSNTTYPDATQTAHGLMSAADKKKLDGVEVNANNYVHPTAKSLATVALRKFSTNAQGHVISAEAVTKADITALGIPGNTYTHPAGDAPSKAEGLYKFSTDARSHVASVTPVTKADITALGIPGSQPIVPDVPEWVDNPMGSDITLDAGIAGVTDGSTVSEGMNEHGESIAANAAAIAGKQDTIADLATIRSGAAKGATALQSVPSTYRTAAQQDAIHDRTKADLASPNFTGTPTAPTATVGTNSAQVATCAFVNTSLANALTGAAKYKGGMSVESYNYLTEYDQGWYWVIIEAGTYAGESCEAGDMVFCNTPSGHGADKEDCFDIVQNNIEAIPLSVINALS